MKLNQVSKCLKEESDAFQQKVRQAIDDSIARRGELRSYLLQALKLDSEGEVSKDDFHALLESLGEASEKLGETLLESGFNADVIAGWLNKASAPPMSFRKPILQIVITAILSVDDTSPLNELHQILQVRGFNSNALGTSVAKKLNLDQRFHEMSFWREISMRTRKCIHSAGIESLGEILVKTASELLRVPNFGRKSLRELDDALKQQFGVGVGQIPEYARERYVEMTEARQALNAVAGQLLLSHWDSETLKPEYEGMSWEDRRSKARSGEEVHVQISADPELLEALKREGILYKTQLATAPQVVVDKICDGREDWKQQLPRILNGRSAYGALRLNTRVPLYLQDNVVVYQEKSVSAKK